MRHALEPRSSLGERGQAAPPRASSIILGMTVVLGVVVLVAKLITEFLLGAA